MISTALLGFGIVGSGTAEVLTRNQALIESRIGDSFRIRYILDLREFPDSPFAPLIVHDFNTILNDPEISVVAEMMGGSHPAYDFTKALLMAGKSVVTSNKEVVANFGTELLQIARENGVHYLFEASVGGGIPIISPLRKDFSSNRITAISGILNGTTNYILTRMKNEGAAFDDVLRDAQRLGYAERNPVADVEGLDAARKTVILAAMAFGKRLDPNAIHCEGITNVTPEDCAYAESAGYAIKLIGHTSLTDGRVVAMVSPRAVRADNPIYGVNDVFNGILVEADMVGKVMFYGPGAGKLPTASAVAADMIEIMSGRTVDPAEWTDAGTDDIADFDGYVCRSLLTFDVPEEQAAGLRALFGASDWFETLNGKHTFVTEPMSEAETLARIASAGFPLVSRVRVLD